jgi:phosphosulfolactate phosphohydrolase-like enzyme
MALDQWDMAKDDLLGYIDKSAHRNRLRNLISDRLLKYTFTLNSSKVVPVLKRYKIVPAKD